LFEASYAETPETSNATDENVSVPPLLEVKEL